MTKIVLRILNLSLLSGILCTCRGLHVTKLYLLGLYPISGRVWPGAQACLPATNLAFQDINANPSILPGYEVVLIPIDTACDGGKATDSMYSELYNTSTTKVMVIGGGCSVATEPTAHASHYWNLIQISYAAVSPELSRRSMYPLFFRLSQSSFASNAAFLALFRLFGWKKMATIHQSVDLYSLALDDFHRKASRDGLEIIAAESFVDDPTTQVESIKKSGARIIVGGFYEDKAIKVFCAAYHQGLFGGKYVWIIPGYYDWNNRLRELDNSVDCSPDQIRTVVSNHIGVHGFSVPPDDNTATALAGMTTSQFMGRFKAISGADDPETLIGIQQAPYAYDTIWTAALALHATEQRLRQLDPPRSLKDYAYDSATVDIMFDVLSNLSFKGITGSVRFTSSGDRVGRIQLNQIQGEVRVNIGEMDPAGETGEDIIWDGYTPIYWQNGAPPVDFLIEREDRQTIYMSVFLTGASLAGGGVAIACSFLAFNIHFRKLRVIKMSSPNINNLMLIGGMLAYVSIIFLGIDTALVTTETFVLMCKTRTWCLSVGFSLAFGSMFSKTWRVHKIFTNKRVKTVLKDSILFSSVAILVLLDVLILILWEIVDPVTAVEKQGEKVVDSTNDDIVYTQIHMMCESENQTYWIGAFYVIDGLLLVFGAFLAWETRKVSIPALNDSKYIGACVYNVLVLSFVGAPVSFVLEERNAHYALVATLVWFATTLTLCVVFIPKIRMRNDVRPAQSTMVSHINTGSQSTHSEHAQREIELLRQEVQRLKGGPSETKQEQLSERN